MTLPVKTSAQDVSKVAHYLKSKPSGATLAEASAVIGPTPVDGRKLRAYVSWGLVSEDDGCYKLTERGRRLTRSPEDERACLQEVISAVPPYRSAIEFAHHQKFKELSIDELAANWHDNFRDHFGTANDRSIKDSVGAFFSIAEGAGLGKYILGRRGSTTRLEINKTAVQAFVEGGPTAPPWTGQAHGVDDAMDEGVLEAPSSDGAAVSGEAVEGRRVEGPPTPVATALRVFISHGKNMEIVEQVKTTLDIAGIESEVAVEAEATAIPVPEKVFGAMRKCSAGVICVSAEAASSGQGDTFVLNQNVLIEIGAAFVLYDKQVVLLWDKRIPVPSNLQGLYRCEFDGTELSWSTGMKLMKAIKEFKA